MKLYGIPNCTTVKKARAWLAHRALDVAFHDYKKPVSYTHLTLPTNREV